MNRREIAQETLLIQQQGYYNYNGIRVNIGEAQKLSEDKSRLFTPEEGVSIIGNLRVPVKGASQPSVYVTNEATVQAIIRYAETGAERVGVLNFASAKNPGGGFLNGAMAQEESLAASSGLYGTQLRHERFYSANRACRSMMYTDHAIYSPDVVFFRDTRFNLIRQPIRASVLTLPAVNYGQVVQKGENKLQAERVMKDRMRLALAVFAHQGDTNLILGAYGCGVFGNDPVKVANWWHDLLEAEGYGTWFSTITFAVLDTSKDRKCYNTFERVFRVKEQRS
ncbi:TIGR02452 family protein [Paenibacillus glycanilyticus]|uniref:TIGR02452 family protein n=1 Tax=Paenibacillus glycanilyticus TaxID=126569 RepID=UPI003EBD49F3